MLPDELITLVESFLTAKNASPQSISETRATGGGCINEAYTLKTNAGKYFIKYNSAKAYPAMFEKEALGLKLLASTNSLAVPEIISLGETGKYAWLLLGFIESHPAGRNFWHAFGTGLSALHRNTNENFGLDHDNYIGSLVQKNNPNPDFCNFFILNRIEPQLATARNKGAFGPGAIRCFNSLFNNLHNLIPPEKPALLHGDLWSGNFMVNAEGSPCLIDPAVYFGHREADIAMTQLFGGFSPEFYALYNQAWPMEKGWQNRMDIFNLYPLLVHVNLFGGGYVQQVLQIIRQF